MRFLEQFELEWLAVAGGAAITLLTLGLCFFWLVRERPPADRRAASLTSSTPPVDAPPPGGGPQA